MKDAGHPETRHWLALLRMPGIGGKSVRRLLERFSPADVLAASRADLRSLDFSERQIDAILQPDWQRVDYDLSWLSQAGNYILTLDDPEYPAQLREIADPPPVLFVKGKPELLLEPQLAIVGSRNPSPPGVDTATEFAKALAEAGYTVTSGMALGIDAASHWGALSVGGNTVAVAGTGLDRVYPACHKALATEIAAKGALVSEFPPGTTANAGHFPKRNRIISGLCVGLLVVEAAQQSGSLITARLALEQNREVFAIPGSIHNPLARGCNGLIRQGAKLVETADDIFEELGQYNQRSMRSGPELPQTALDLEQQNLLNLIPYSPTTVDTLVRNSSWAAEEVSSMLLVLELQGYIAGVAGGSYLRIK
ncbi:DNA-processing protein DprA [Methylomonas sp. MV1]|nr:DNA-processing protein DprA [Methylomonas sp. MV1]MDT4332625.1 DNA-processing protein DprA [Methylomonas sp. MV1]